MPFCPVIVSAYIFRFLLETVVQRHRPHKIILPVGGWMDEVTVKGYGSWVYSQVGDWRGGGVVAERMVY